MILMIDLDGVLCTEETTFERALAKPLPGAQAGMQALRDQGHTLIVHTARGWAEYRMTKAWLDNHQIAYDQLLMGKPIATHTIDDRAIRFEGWESLPQHLFGGASPELPGGAVDELYLRILRQATRTFLEDIAHRSDLLDPVLEVGPMTQAGVNKGVFSRMPETFLDSRELFEGQGHRFLSLDLDPTAQPDLCCDFMALEHHVEPSSLGAVVLLSVIEHIPQIWAIPGLLRNVLKPGGRAFILTPWNLRFHGPRPDCWRLSDDGYRALFSDTSGLIIESLDAIPCPGRSLSPVGFTAVLHRP